MEHWTVEYVDRMAFKVLDDAFTQRRRSVFSRMREGNFDWDRTVGMVVRAWVYAREHPTWMREVPYCSHHEAFAGLLGYAIEKTTSTGVQPTLSASALAHLHVEKQIEERQLVTEFVTWVLKGQADA